MIPIYQPFVANNQKKYVMDCMDSNWISSQGKYIGEFENKIADYIGVKHAISTFNGSVSLQLILKGLGIGPGDQVIAPSLTYAATISCILLAGAKPVLVDCEENYQMNLDQIEALINAKTKAVMVAQLYGNGPDMSRLAKLCKKNDLYLIEDAAEAFGCIQDGKKIGSFGTASSFSFFGNKTITTGEGGVICTNDDSLAKKLRLLKNQNHIGNFIHSAPGFNFRMTNIQAAIGCAQMEHLEEIIIVKKSIADFYRKNLPKNITRVIPTLNSSEWMPLFQLPVSTTYSKFAQEMAKLNVDTRPVFSPVHLMKGFDCKVAEDMDVSTHIHLRGFNLPSFPDLSMEQLSKVVSSVEKVIRG